MGVKIFVYVLGFCFCCVMFGVFMVLIFFGVVVV